MRRSHPFKSMRHVKPVVGCWYSDGCKLCSSCSGFVVFRYERDFMTSLSDDNQSDIIEAFNSTSRYIDDLLNIDKPYFEGMVNQIYPSELQLNKK